MSQQMVTNDASQVSGGAEHAFEAIQVEEKALLQVSGSLAQTSRAKVDDAPGSELDNWQQGANTSAKNDSLDQSVGLVDTKHDDSTPSHATNSATANEQSFYGQDGLIIKGTRIQVRDLQSAPEYNDHYGIVRGYLVDKEMYKIKFESDGKTKGVAAKNIFLPEQQ